MAAAGALVLLVLAGVGVLAAACVALALLCCCGCCLRPQPSAPARSDAGLNIAFVHPDLGIGGAERLVVDAAVALQRLGHKVRIYTARHDVNRCFRETKDGTLSVQVLGAWLPRLVLGRCYAACTILRVCWVSLCLVAGPVALGRQCALPDIIFVDLVSACLPVLRLARARGILFYCHFPDKLLVAPHSGAPGLLRRLYRGCLDAVEEQTTGLADVIFVNSRFTAGVFKDVFPHLHQRGVQPPVLYPPVDLGLQDQHAAEAENEALEWLGSEERLLLSINRFERKKNIGLAVRVLAGLPEATRSSVRLCLAGGYDPKLRENVEHTEELKELADSLGVGDRVVQLRSVPPNVKALLFRHASCLLYTPDREHFGIVPVEAMYARVPVLAVNSGGPLESLVDGVTGFLRPPDPEVWASVVQRLLDNPQLRHDMGQAGHSRAVERFSLEAFGQTLDTTVRQLASSTGKKAE